MKMTGRTGQGMRLGALLLPALAALLLAACDGDFDQRVEEATVFGEGGGAFATTANPNLEVAVRGIVSIGGALRNGKVALRAVKQDGSIDFSPAGLLGSTITHSDGVYQASVRDLGYRGPIVVEITGGNVNGAVTQGGNPATASSDKLHQMGSGHVLYSVLPYFDGQRASDVQVTPLTTVAVMRGLSFTAPVQGGVSAGMFGLMCRQVAGFFALERIRGDVPIDFAITGSVGFAENYGYVLAALSQVALDIGVQNVFDFHLGMALDARDDGVLNGSIGPIPGTAIAMPDLSQAGLVGNALRNNFLAPLNPERLVGPENTVIQPGDRLDTLTTALDAARDINASTEAYDLAARVPEYLELSPGQEVRTRIFALENIGNGDFHPYGDSGGPSFVDYAFISSSPIDIDVQPLGRIVVDPAAPPGLYNIALTISPAGGQTMLTGPVLSYSIVVRVR